MRTEQRWNEIIKGSYFTDLSPRLISDLTTLPTPKGINKMSINSMFIYGPTESGKTVLATQLLMEERKRIYLEGGPSDEYHHCKFISMTDLINEIKSTFNSTSEKTEQEVLNYYTNIHLLVLDDFGTVKPTDWIYNTIYSIINYRYEFLKKTIITSNLSLPEIAIILGDDRITSRIERMGELVKKSTWKK